MADEPDDDVEARLDRLEATLEELRAAVAADDRVSDPRGQSGPTETALRLTERLAVPAAVTALEANVRLLEFLQERLREVEEREPRDAGWSASDVSDRMLDRLDDTLARMEDAIVAADLPRDAEARRLLERARDLNADVRDRVRSRADRSEPSVITIDVEEELDQLRDEVDEEEAPDEDDE